MSVKTGNPPPVDWDARDVTNGPRVEVCVHCNRTAALIAKDTVADCVDSPSRLHAWRVDADRAIDPATGMQRSYVVLSDDERAKGFVRPVRESYRHVGAPGPRWPLRELTDEERERHAPYGYVKYEPTLGRFWTRKELDAVGKGCGTVTTMGRKLAETYAREPAFYSGTFCCRCCAHFPVGAQGEFVWVDDNTRVGT